MVAEMFYVQLETAVSLAAGTLQVAFAEKNLARTRKHFVAALEASGWRVSSAPIELPRALPGSPAAVMEATHRAHSAPRRSTKTTARRARG